MSSSYDHHVTGRVRSDITITCIDISGRSHDIDTVFSYDEADPYAVTVTFLTHEGNLPWTFARDLLARGLNAPVGDGDVHVCPSVDERGHAVVIIELSSPDGHLVTESSSDAVNAFVQRTFDAVPAGEESQHLDIESMISQLLA
ncbi:SsgA family sporulation/cell division regulator [Nocardioides yefusunii]|uniref:SsgA family sporulation/cell division regulator n=1 Tax=Nocardioides yefusunii TaxID=2500546 RepID=A0ABW1QS26_9ACTN|nr:SsgA family sporulation/cell division regulator [Nocardioides yefusunii]